MDRRDGTVPTSALCQSLDSSARLTPNDEPNWLNSDLNERVGDHAGSNLRVSCWRLPSSRSIRTSDANARNTNIFRPCAGTDPMRCHCVTVAPLDPIGEVGREERDLPVKHG